MARVKMTRGQLSTIVEAWLEENGGGRITYWDVGDNGAFCGLFVDDGDTKAIEELPSNGDDQRSHAMPINSDGTLTLPRPEPVAYDESKMEDVAVCPGDLTWQDEVDYLRKVYRDGEVIND